MSTVNTSSKHHCSTHNRSKSPLDEAQLLYNATDDVTVGDDGDRGSGGSLGGRSCTLSCGLECKAVGFLGTSDNVQALDVDVVLIGATQHDVYIV